MRRFIEKILAKVPLKYIKNGAILIIGLLAYGIIGSRFIMGLNLLDSAYYSIITMATVGYGDILPITPLQKVFSMTLALSGVGTITYVFSIILDNFSNKISIFSKGAKMYKKIKNMKDYYILCGYGRVGKVVFKELKKRNQNVIIIEKEEDELEDVEADQSTIIIQKDATNGNLLKKLITDKCRSIIVTTGSDVSNLFIVLTIREIQPNAWVVSRCSETENINRLYKAGANKVISPELIGGEDLYFEAAKPHLIRVTLKHNVEDIAREINMILEHNCTLENIDYHFPGIRAPLSRKIGVVTTEEVEKFEDSLKKNPQKRESLKNLYDSVHEIHSHWISGSNKTYIDKLIKEMEKTDRIIGIDLTNEEIAEITSKYIK